MPKTLLVVLATYALGLLACKQQTIEDASGVYSAGITVMLPVSQFVPPSGSPSWSSMNMSFVGANAKVRGTNKTLSAASFVSHRSTVQVAGGDYNVNVVYNDAAGRLLYEPCVHTQNEDYLIASPAFQTQFQLCGVNSSVPVGQVQLGGSGTQVAVAPSATQGSSGNQAPGAVPYLTSGAQNSSGNGPFGPWLPGYPGVPTISPASYGSPASTPSGPSASGGLPALSIAAAGNAAFQITNYGQNLQTNKLGLVAALNVQGATAEQEAVIIAIAMQETQLMLPGERDASKDGTMSANVSILNVNFNMLQQLGYQGNDYGASLNDPSQLGTVVGYLLQAFQTWGIQSTLNYQRGGYTAFQDGVSYGAGTYRNAILTIYDQIAADPKLENDGRRVEINVPHV